MMDLYIADFKHSNHPRISKAKAEAEFDGTEGMKLVVDWLNVPYFISRENLDKEVDGMFVSKSMVACLDWLIDKMLTHQRGLLDQVSALTEMLMTMSELKSIARAQDRSMSDG